MKLFINIKRLSFEEENNKIEHEIISSISDEEFYAYDYMLELPVNAKFIKDTLKTIYKKDDKRKNTKEVKGKVFMTWENKAWISFPIYEIIDGKIIPFDYTKYQYFNNAYRRLALGAKINKMYNKSSEKKIHRKTLEFILNELNLGYPIFDKYNKKVKDIINRNPKN